jgi:hypothetical protein
MDLIRLETPLPHLAPSSPIASTLQMSLKKMFFRGLLFTQASDSPC